MNIVKENALDLVSMREHLTHADGPWMEIRKARYGKAKKAAIEYLTMQITNALIEKHREAKKKLTLRDVQSVALDCAMGRIPFETYQNTVKRFIESRKAPTFDAMYRSKITSDRDEADEFIEEFDL